MTAFLVYESVREILDASDGQVAALYGNPFYPHCVCACREALMLFIYHSLLSLLLTKKSFLVLEEFVM